MVLLSLREVNINTVRALRRFSGCRLRREFPLLRAALVKTAASDA